MNLTLTIPESTQPPITVTVGGTTELTSYVAQVAGLPDYPATFPPAIGSAGNQAVAGNDPRLTNSRAPTAHTHPLADLTGVTPAAIGAVETTSLSTNGGANKVPQFDANGDLRFSGSAPAGTAASIGGVFFQNLERLWFLNTTNRADGASLFFNELDYAGGGEFQINSPNRMALCLGVNGALQLGLSLPGSKQFVYLQRRGSATSLNTTTKSNPLFFSSTYWNNSAAATGAEPKIQAVPDGTSGHTFLDIYNPAKPPSGFGDDGTETLAVRISKDGMWEKGKAPEWDVLSEASPTQACSIYKSVQVSKLTLSTASRTLAISGAVSGMRGVIYVKQSGAGSYSLTLPTNSAKAAGFSLSTAPGLTDRLQWEFDGNYYFWTIVNGIEAPLDPDAASFVAVGRANISDGAQVDAVNTLVMSLKASNVEGNGSLWSKFSVLYPFVGGNTTAHSRNLKSTSYDITWVNAATHNASGVTGIIANSAYGNTGFNMSLLGQNSASMYVYNRTAAPSTNNQYLLGAQNGLTSRASILMSTSSGEFYTELNQTAPASVGNGGSYAKHVAVNRSGAATVENYINATRTNKTNASVAPWSGNMFLLARNNTGSPAGYTEANLAFAAFGASLTEAEWTAFRAIIDAFQTALGRANP